MTLADGMYKHVKITKQDLKKLAVNYSLKMEEFIKEKGLYQEFYDRKIAPDIICSFDCFGEFNNGK